MKKFFVVFAFFFTLTAAAQVPDKLSYQTIVRNAEGFLVKEGGISVQVSILKGAENAAAVYSEVHQTTTNANGLASFIIGNGTGITGSFGEIDWKNGPYYIRTATDPEGGSNFEIVGVSELLSVPYALNARTAENVFSGKYEDLENKPKNISEFVNDMGYLIDKGQNNKKVEEGNAAQNWTLFGNSGSDAFRDKLGTSDFADLVLVTNNLERLRITADGDINIQRSLEIGENLMVNKNVDLNILGGATVNNGNFSVVNNSATNLTGTLNVDGETDLNSSLDVNNAAATHLTGTLNVDGATDLNSTLDVNNAAATNLTGTLNVDGATDLNNTLDVNNAAATNLTGTLNVDGATDLNSSLDVNNAAATNLTGALNVDGATDLNSSLDVNNAAATNLTGTLTVDGGTNLNSSLAVNNAAATNLTGSLTVAGPATLNSSLNTKGQVTIDVSLQGTDGSYNSYPLQVQGSGQGVAIKLQAGSPNNDNNFITFFNSSGGAVGRIEGETSSEVASDPQFIYDESILIAEEVVAVANVVLAAIPVVVAGVGASAGPCSACLAIEAANLILATANLAAFNIFSYENLGVTYQSGSADYAEWLEKSNPNENISAGDIVGVSSGFISKYTQNSRQFLVISTKPAILGNMPQQGKEHMYEKVAFMGQIPVKVKGTVMAGDYILPSGLNDGTGIAVSPDKIEAEQYQNIVGVAWSSSLMNSGISLVNMAIGLNSNDVAALAVKQEEKLLAMETKLASLEDRFTAMEEGTAYTPDKSETKNTVAEKGQEEMTRSQLIVANMPPELNDMVLEDAMQHIKDQYQKRGTSIEDHPGLNKLFNDAAYKTEILRKTKETYRNSYQSLLEQAIKQK